MATFTVNTTDTIKAQQVFADLFGCHAATFEIVEGNLEITYIYKDQWMTNFMNQTQVEYEPGKFWQVSTKGQVSTKEQVSTKGQVSSKNINQRQYTYTKDNIHTLQI